MMQPQNYIMNCEKHFDEYNELSDAKRKNIEVK